MLHSIRELCRFRVLATDGKVGRASDFYLTDPGWSVRFIVVNTGRVLPGERILVPPEYISVPDGERRTLPIALSKHELAERCAALEGHQPVSQRMADLIEVRYGGAAYGRGGGPVSKVHGSVPREALARAEADVLLAPGQEPQAARIRSGQEVINYQVEAIDGPSGLLEDFLLDDQTWSAQYLVVDTKDWRSPNPRVLVAPTWIQHISWAESRVHMTLTREKIKRSQRYEPGSHSPVSKPKPFIWP